MKKLNKAIIIISKIIEVTYFVGAALLAGLMVMGIGGMTDRYGLLSDITGNETVLDLQGFSLSVSKAGTMPSGAFILFFITGIIVFLLTAMIFRNIYLSFKTAEGKTKFSQGETPFQKDIVRMVREIGIFSISIPVVELIMSVIAGFMFTRVESSVDLTGVVFGLIVLSLSQFFAYGQQLEEDTEGLV